MLNVCFVSTYPPIRCGIAYYTYSLCQALVETSPVRVTVLTERNGKRCVHGGTACIPCFNRGEKYVEHILHAISEVKPEIIHIQHDYTVYGFGDSFFSLLKQLDDNIIVTMHEVHTPVTVEKVTYGLENFARNHAELGKIAAKIIVHSDTMKKWLLAYGVDSKKIAVVPHGTTILSSVQGAEAKRVLGFKETDRVILSMGFVRRAKNDCLLIQTLPMILKEVPDARLLLAGGLHPHSSAGDIEEIQMRRSLVQKLGLGQYVRLIERYVDETELPSIFGSADVLTYLHDRSYVEVSGALHLGIGAGKPIVATDVPRFEEVQEISPETVIRPGKRERLAEILARILTDKDYAERLARRSATYANQTSWTKVAQEHFRIYEEMKRQDTRNC